MKSEGVTRLVSRPDTAAQNEGRLGGWGAVSRTDGKATADDANDAARLPHPQVNAQAFESLQPSEQGTAQPVASRTSEIAAIRSLLAGLRADPDLQDGVLSMQGITVLENYQAALVAIEGLTRGLIRE